MLETTGDTFDGKTFDRPVAEVAAAEVLELFARDAAVGAIRKKPADEKAAALVAWLQGKIAALEAR
jgi:hypothetical protein